MNKLNCCTPIKFDEHTRRPLLPPFPVEDFTVDSITQDEFSGSHMTRLNDQITIGTDEEEQVIAETTTPMMKSTTSSVEHPF